MFGKDQLLTSVDAASMLGQAAAAAKRSPPGDPIEQVTDAADQDMVGVSPSSTPHGHTNGRQSSSKQGDSDMDPGDSPNEGQTSGVSNQQGGFTTGAKA